ncbi:MAG: tryptophan synthase subunit alpha [Eubacteriaceae bacterium]|jgi:tryptophan synthase alpha chain
MTNERIAGAFAEPGAFIGFLTGGDPDADTTVACIKALEDGGADLIEIGVPFSDPCAEGPVIEQADIRALNAGMNTEGIFDIIRRVREDGVQVPIVLLTYVNPVFVYGTERFMKSLQEAGGDGLIIPDLPFEESAPFRQAARAEGMCLISLVAPTSKERIRMIASEADGFLYVVSSMGVTGVRSEITTDIPSIIREIRSASDIPAAVGFGISTPEQAAKICETADGAITGSAIVRIIEQYKQDAPEHVREYTADMKAGAAGREQKSA